MEMMKCAALGLLLFCAVSVIPAHKDKRVKDALAPDGKEYAFFIPENTILYSKEHLKPSAGLDTPGIVEVQYNSEDDWNPDNLDAAEQKEILEFCKQIAANRSVKAFTSGSVDVLDGLRKVLKHDGSQLIQELKKSDCYDSVMEFAFGNKPSVPSKPSAPAQSAASVKPASQAPSLSAAPAVSAWSSQEEESLRSAIVAAARTYQGARYVYGAMSPPSGKFDCSGLIGQAYLDAAGYTIPRSSKEIYRLGKAITEQELKPGDIVVFTTDMWGSPSHVALWINQGTIIQAVSAGRPTGVIISAMPDKYWTPRIIGYRTFFSNGALIPKSKSPVASLPISDFSIRLGNSLQRGVDNFEAAVKTVMRFSVYNDTNRQGNFTLYFYRIGADRAKGERQEFQLKAKEKFESELLVLEETGQYRLEIRGNTDLYFEHTWNVR
ncbi:MAG: C40 family peptidase [Treponema sp.]|jgi:cell wall-associated NlpC family hydrolase|nr:C40 family peptidase [Treponema sp.]